LAIFLPDAIPDKHKRISELIQRKYNLKIKKYTSGRKIAKDYGQKIFELMNEAYSPLYGYSPLTQRQIDQYVKMYLPILDLRMVTLITDANDEQIRKLIYTTNAVEGFHRQVRKVTKTKGVFPNDMALMKLIYLAVINISKKWTQPLHNWALTAGQLRIKFGDRMPLDI
jgi:hypothetical protein